MSKLIYLNLLLFLTTVAARSQQNTVNIQLLAQHQVRMINNYAKLSDRQLSDLTKKAEYWLSRLQKLKTKDANNVLAPNYLDLYTGVVHQTYSKRAVHLLPNLNIAYVPDLDMFYTIYLKYYEYLLRYGQNTPLPEVIFGMLNQETRFLWLVGDYGHSIAPCQLHAATARWLLRSEKCKKRFGQLIYFDKKGKHHFRSQEAMIEFMFEFLINTKNYAQGQERQGIAAYNGSQPHEGYTRAVVRFAIQYLALRAMHNNAYSQQPKDKKALAGDIKKMLKKHFLAQEIELLQFDGLYQAASRYFEDKEGSFGPASQAIYAEQEAIRISSGRGRVLAPHIYFGRPYIVKQADVYIFSYFREHLDTTVFYHNKIMEQQLGYKPRYTQNRLDTSFIYLYYETVDKDTGRTKRNFIKNVAQYKKIANEVTVQCNKVSGKVYTIPGFPVYYEKLADNTSATPSFFMDDQFINPALKRVKIQ